MSTPFRHTRIVLAIAGCAMALGSAHVHGAAFALAEQSGSGLGNAFAGGAAAGEDAATVWINPAAMSRIGSMQAVAAIHLITPSIKFHDDGSRPATNQPLGHEGGDAGSLNIVPNMYLVVPITKEATFGLGVNAPFGLVTEYGDGWIGRYHGVKSDVKTLNVNPALAWKFSDAFTLGVGVNYQRIDATFSSAVNYSAGLLSAAAGNGIAPGTPTFNAIAQATSGLDARSTVDGDDSAWGWNIGLLYNLDDKSRIGAHYRSSIKYKVAGNVHFDKPGLPSLPPSLAPVVGALANGVNGVLADGGVTSDIEVPSFTNLSYFRTLNDRWDVMVDVQYTGWSSISELKFVRNNGTVLQNTPENFRDTWRFSVGTNYRLNDQWMFRGGLAYDQTPVKDEFRTPRLPDESRVWVSLGAQYRMNKNLKADVGFTYITAGNASIDDATGGVSANGLLKGNYDATVTILSGQVTYTF
jgi:long-chain fatty acid transport protein